ncbi:histidine kinase [Actinoplanes sp. TBRC 11911]|uniref:ATP-binding protein n=1 Tax=Actinoplanes sp. TBRC 11911 TaxID=2729386 RepID=UPI00145FCAE2|nr:ATP-binding protein [Actinoplanes sp. TBRC 11911]NMO52282.1 histidine kinase [Actinoplanes sp. TBRC 11911]
MTPSRHLLRTLAFAVLYLLATLAGRLTIMDGTNLSLVWPAAGVAAVWFAVQGGSRRIAYDALGLSIITMLVNVLTGAPAALAGVFVLANLVQAGLFAYLIRRWLPSLWGAGGDEQITRSWQLWRLVAITALATLAGVLVGPTGMWLLNGEYSPTAAAVWIARNSAGTLLVGTALLRLGALRRKGGPCPVRVALRGAVVEGTVLIAVSAVAYVGVFTLAHGLPLAFVLLVMTVWAGSRMSTTFVILHALAFGAASVAFTLIGDGPFAAIESNPLRALVSQLFVAVIAVIGLALALGRDERVALQLSADEQTRIFASVIDAMGEGLAVIDADGGMLLRNPAGARLLGVAPISGDKMASTTHYGLSHTDGTPIAPGELPFQRALATGSSHAMDLLVRNTALPEGRILAVRATPLPLEVAGRAYAVSTFSDVTADRRHRDELAAFAGVVAHDLSNPLTTVEGWSSEVADELGDDAGLPADGIRRIQRAAARMRNLINDLLAYATARDNALTPGTVDLTDLTTDIVAGWADRAESTGTPPPRVTIGELPHVHADPAQVRQLLDNLIGNAIKYTATDLIPTITVTATAGAGDVRVTVADNGIGIPPGQHVAVFDNFHRAHREAGYAGTGLGLPICKRIVERHGGRILAEDNPGGTGSAFTFTLPAADTPSAARLKL